jgi:hypothetical protein
LIHLFSFDLTMSCPLAKFFSMLLSAWLQMLLNSTNVLMCICASTGSIPESTYTAASAVLVCKESIIFFFEQHKS